MGQLCKKYGCLIFFVEKVGQSFNKALNNRENMSIK